MVSNPFLAPGLMGLLIGSRALLGYMPDLTESEVQLVEGLGQCHDLQQKFPFDRIEWHKEEEAQALLDRPAIISLSRRIDRFNATKTLMERAGFENIERFEGIDAYQIKDQSIFEELGVYTGGLGQKGCAASHLLLWKKFLDHDGRDFLFIGEDDLLPHTDFAQLLPLYWGKTPKGFDIVMVGNQMQAKACDPLVVSMHAFCTHAYIISKAGAKRLLELYKALPKDAENMHVIDMFLIQMMRRNLINYYCYNGAHFPDKANLAKGNILMHRDNGICFQNANLEISIHGK